MTFIGNFINYFIDYCFSLFHEIEDEISTCYECQSNVNGICGDPFNVSDSVNVITCKGLCIKWVQHQKNGKLLPHMVRYNYI